MNDRVSGGCPIHSRSLRKDGRFWMMPLPRAGSFSEYPPFPKPGRMGHPTFVFVLTENRKADSATPQDDSLRESSCLGRNDSVIGIAYRHPSAGSGQALKAVP